MAHGKLTKKKKKKEKETDAGNATNVERPSAQEAVTAAEGRRQKAEGRRQTGRMSIQWQASGASPETAKVNGSQCNTTNARVLPLALTHTHTYHSRHRHHSQPVRLILRLIYLDR